MSVPLHHAAIHVHDVDASLRFYREGLGLRVLMDQTFDGDWPELFGAPSRRLRSVFLGDPSSPEAGIVELVAFDGGVPARGVSERAAALPPSTGFFLLSFFVDVDATLARLDRLGLAREPRRISQPSPNGPIAMVTVRDPDGVLVELVDLLAHDRPS